MNKSKISSVTYDVVVERDVKVPMPDGTILLADRHYPRGVEKFPTILMRSPYGRAAMSDIEFGQPFAKRGFHVFIQSCRGTFGSGGKFRPYLDDHADGLATVAWIKKQPWFNGQLATMGQSYLGYTQWAIAADAGPELKAMVAEIGMHNMREHTYPSKSFALDHTLFWAYSTTTQESRPPSDDPKARLEAQEVLFKTMEPAFRMLPLIESYKLATNGQKVDFFEEWLTHEPDDPHWDPGDWTSSIHKIKAPVSLVTHWFDLFLPQMITQYNELKRAGQNPYMLMARGPHFSIDPEILEIGMHEYIAWMNAYLMGDRSMLRKKPVRIFIMGSEKWRDFDEWPPKGYVKQRWHLQPNKMLDIKIPVQSEPDYYRYDPANPTPAVGGSSLLANTAGQADNRELEARPDVLAYSSDVLKGDIEVIGPISVELFAKSSLEHTDFFARLCDVDPSGKSVNICDNLIRLKPGYINPEGDGSFKLNFELWPTAYCFRLDHRIRLQVSSGAHPRFVRNLGSGEPLATGKTLHIANQTIYHDPTHPSAIVLPIKK